MEKKFFLVMAFTLLAGTIQAQTTNMVELEKNLTDNQKKQIELRSLENAEDAFAELCLKYQFPESEVAKLRKLLSNRETLKAQYSVIYASSTINRIKAKMATDDLYKDSINTILIPFNAISGQNLGFALNLCIRGFCTPEQEKTLMKEALRIARDFEKYPGLNVWNEEIDILQKTLDGKRLNAFFELKNIDKINQAYHYSWKRLYDAGLTAQLDSTNDGAQALSYYTQESMINDLYKYREDLRIKNLQELYKHQPYIIRLVAGLDVKKNVEENEKNVGNEFVW